MKSIPTIDLSLKEDCASEVARACSQWGFFQVVNHGLDPALIGRVWEETHGFFALPRNEKLKILRSKDNPRGYYDRELTKNTRDLKEVFDFGDAPYPELPDDHPDNRDPINGYNLWPADQPSFKAVMLEYFAACEDLAMRLLQLFSLGLGSPADGMDGFFSPRHSSFMRLNYYPLDDPVDVADQVPNLGDMALHHHTDAGAFTILLQDQVGGLQVFAEREWLDVQPLQAALVINTADMMQVWSNDRYQAPSHRVLPVVDQPRYSIPFFFNPAYRCDCAPLAALLKDEKPHYRAINWGEFRQLRTDGDYADYGKEVQLDDYRLSR